MKDQDSPETIERKRWYTTSGIPLEEKRREEETPPITHQEKPHRARFYTSLYFDGKKVSLNLPLEEKPMWQTFVKAMKRDGSSASAFLGVKMLQWYKGHAPGNPQTPLERFPLDLVQKGEVLLKDPNDDRWQRLWQMSNEELLERQAKLLNWPNTYLERLEMSMILLHRRLNPPPKD